LQSPEDLFYFQQVLVRLRPQVVLETGTYRGGLAFFAASLFSQLGLEASRVVTIDAFDPESNYQNLDNHALCPVCHDCVKAHETDLWRRHVVFFQGNSLRLADNAHRFVEELRRRDGRRGPVLITLDAQHSFDGTLLELHFYAGLVDVGSYVVLQDARLDETYLRAGPQAAGLRLLELQGQWVWDREVEVFGHTQHMWLRRVAQGPPVELSFVAHSQDLVEQNPMVVIAQGGRCEGPTEVLQEHSWPDSPLVCHALCLRDGECRFATYSARPTLCTLRRDCDHMEPAPMSAIYEKQI